MKGVKIETINPVHSDSRGTITDLLNAPVNHVGLITTKQGETRGNHYHKTSVQYSYILSGKFEVLLAKPEDLADLERITLNAGELITIQPNIVHTFKALEDAVMIDIISQSRDGSNYEKDVVKGIVLKY